MQVHKEERVHNTELVHNERIPKNKSVQSKELVAGFVYLNLATISNCSCITKYPKNRIKGGAFASRNPGFISDSVSICLNRDKDHLPAFTDQMEHTMNCSVLPGTHNKSEGKTIDPPADIVPTSNVDILISSMEDLMEMASKVNTGDQIAATANYVLTCDINLKGRAWSPIGLSALIPFQGSFDGNGYSIHNFIVKSHKFEYTGLFGYVHNGTIENLHVDGIISSGTYAGTMAGSLENGIIKNCVANGQVYGAKYIGGFVARNNGLIEKCMFQGLLENSSFLPILYTTTLVASLFFLLSSLPVSHPQTTPTMSYRQTPELAKYYPPIQFDEDSSQIKDDTSEPITEGNSVSFSFASTLYAANGTAKATLSFANPGESNHNIIIELQITDAEMLRTTNSTGRDQAQQKQLEASPDYSTETSRIILARSGAIAPGYHLESIPLQALPDGTYLKAGEYHAIIYLSFYDMITNEMSMVHSQTPVTLVITE